MNIHRMTQNVFAMFFAFILLLFGCFTILDVQQPAAVKPGDQITVQLLVRTEADPDWGLIDDGQYGILGIMMPDDWTVTSVRYEPVKTGTDTSDVEGRVMEYLDPADPDNAPGGKVDYWTDSLEYHYPPPDDMWWEVYQAVEEDSTQIDTGYVNVFIEFTVGQREGTYDMAYFTSMATLDWDFEWQYSYSPGHTVTVSATAIEPSKSVVPGAFSLYQNYPNPFNPETRIRYELEKRSQIQLTLHDINGKTIRVLSEGAQSAGQHQYILNGSDLASGVYMYRLTDGVHTLTRKLVMVR